MHWFETKRVDEEILPNERLEHILEVAYTEMGKVLTQDEASRDVSDIHEIPGIVWKGRQIKIVVSVDDF